MADQRLAQTPLKVVIKMARRTCLVHVFTLMAQSRTGLETGCVAQVGVLECLMLPVWKLSFNDLSYKTA